MISEVYEFMNAFCGMTACIRLFAVTERTKNHQYVHQLKAAFRRAYFSKSTTDEWLVVKISCAREAYTNFEICAIELVGGDQIEALTKETNNRALDML